LDGVNHASLAWGDVNAASPYLLINSPYFWLSYLLKRDGHYTPPPSVGHHQYSSSEDEVHVCLWYISVAGRSTELEVRLGVVKMRCPNAGFEKNQDGLSIGKVDIIANIGD
jgi:hypothetical protein